MFECYVVVFLPLRFVEETDGLKLVVAKYNFDPGLNEGDLVRVVNASIDVERVTPEYRAIAKGLPRFSFDAQVTGRRKVIVSDPSDPIFRLLIDLDAEQGKRAEIVDTLKRAAPKLFEDFALPWDIADSGAS